MKFTAFCEIYHWSLTQFAEQIDGYCLVTASFPDRTIIPSIGAFYARRKEDSSKRRDDKNIFKGELYYAKNTNPAQAMDGGNRGADDGHAAAARYYVWRTRGSGKL
jgi:hypothetical protein